MKNVWLLVASCFALHGCTSPESRAPIFLPMLAAPEPGTEQVYLTAALSGTLTTVDGCVKVFDDVRSSPITVLWHPGTELAQDDRGYYLRDNRTKVVLRFGTRVEFGGGEMPQAWAERQNPEAAKRCGPPYASGWLPTERRFRPSNPPPLP